MALHALPLALLSLVSLAAATSRLNWDGLTLSGRPERRATHWAKHEDVLSAKDFLDSPSVEIQLSALTSSEAAKIARSGALTAEDLAKRKGDPAYCLLTDTRFHINVLLDEDDVSDEKSTRQLETRAIGMMWRDDDLHTHRAILNAPTSKPSSWLASSSLRPELTVDGSDAATVPEEDKTAVEAAGGFRLVQAESSEGGQGNAYVITLPGSLEMEVDLHSGEESNGKPHFMLKIRKVQTTPTIHGLWAKSLLTEETEEINLSSKGLSWSAVTKTNVPEGFDREGSEAFRATSLDSADCVFATEWL